jgi:hypothetical protein
MAMANEAMAAPTEMQRLYRSFWIQPSKERIGSASPTEAIAASLQLLAEGLPKTLVTSTYRLYTAALAEFNPSEIVLAFCRATEECRYFPAPATLREYSGRAVDGDPIAREAKEKLLYLLEGMRGPHGPKLVEIPGRVLYGTEADPRGEDGRITDVPIREVAKVFPLDRRLRAALGRLGWGDSARGISVVAEHPALRRDEALGSADGQYRTNQLRTADEILKRFTDAYREV